MSFYFWFNTVQVGRKSEKYALGNLLEGNMDDVNILVYTVSDC